MGFLDFIFKKEEYIGGGTTYEENNTTEPSTSLEDITGDFLLVVDDVFTIAGRGTIVTGTIASGSINVGDTVKLKRMASESIRAVTITGIEMFRKVVDSAREGESVGLLLRGITRDDIGAGDTLFQGDMVK